MKSTTLPQTDWQLALNEISRSGLGRVVSIAVVGEDLGAQIAAEQVRLQGISYDPKDDAVAVDTGNLEHRIASPKQIDLAYDGVTVSALEIIGADDRRHIVSFDPPISLGTPNARYPQGQ
jgi:hypothetical protein